MEEIVNQWIGSCSPCFSWNPYARCYQIRSNFRESVLQSLFFVEPVCKLNAIAEVVRELTELQSLFFVEPVCKYGQTTGRKHCPYVVAVLVFRGTRMQPYIYDGELCIGLSCSPCFSWNPYATWEQHPHLEFRPVVAVLVFRGTRMQPWDRRWRPTSKSGCCSPCFSWNPYATMLRVGGPNDVQNVAVLVFRGTRMQPPKISPDPASEGRISRKSPSI